MPSRSRNFSGLSGPRLVGQPRGWLRVRYVKGTAPTPISNQRAFGILRKDLHQILQVNAESLEGVGAWVMRKLS